MKGEEILDVRVVMKGGNVKFQTPQGEVVMIPFSGTASGRIFHGIVEDCGVDTQIVNAAGVRHMSARYCLTGTDCAGNPCHIYVENNGYFSGKFHMPFPTVPTFLTDSEVLAPYLHADRFVGEGVSEADGLHIHFYELAPGGETET